MTTIDSITATARLWLDQHEHRLPGVPILIVDGKYDDSTYVAVGFNPDTFGAAFADPPREPMPTLIYRLQRNGYMAMSPVSFEFARDIGFAFVHQQTARLLH